MWKYLIFGAAIVLQMALKTSGSLQQVIFFNGSRCTGESETITATTVGLNETWIANATSVRVIGPWQIWVRSMNGSGVGRLEHDARPPNGICSEKYNFIVNPEFAFTSAEKFGPDDFTTSRIILFTGSFSSGRRFEIDRATEQIAASPITINRAMLFSNTSWVVYEGPNFTGNAVQLDSIGLYDGYNVIYDISLLAGSIKRFIEPDNANPPPGKSTNLFAQTLFTYSSCFTSFIVHYLAKFVYEK